MKLGAILQKIKTPHHIVTNSDLIDEIHINDIALDSRLVQKGSIFFALSGKFTDGHEFISSAINNGATVIVTDKASDIEGNVVVIQSQTSFDLLTEFLTIFYSPLPANIYAVTGTNGKTTIAEFGRQILQFLGRKSASIGTLGVTGDIDHSLIQKSILTTPDIVSFYKNLSVLKDNDIDDVFIEASSIGIEQKRIAGLDISVGAFSNFTQDHLDYHGSMDDYFKCKMLLFKEVLKEGAIAVLNRDIPKYEELLEICKKKHHHIITYGFKESDFKISAINRHDLHQNITFEYRNKSYSISLNIVGEFQAFNVLCALAAVLSKYKISDEALENLLKKFTQIRPACGRMQKVATLDNKAQIFIDFAHSSDALENVLHLAQDLAKARVIVLFGCGGNRDAKKRPIMGKIACDLADLVIVTEDNPRFEEASLIRKDVLSGCNEKAIEIENRKEAIEQAIKMLQPNDILILSGKGHEKYQVIGDERLAFDEEQIVKNAIK